MAENNYEDKIVMSKFAFERMQAKDERNDHWRNVALIWAFATILVLIVLLVGSNALWLYYWNQYDYMSEEYTEVEASQDGDGINLVSGGDMNYGTDGYDTQETEQFENTP